MYVCPKCANNASIDNDFRLDNYVNTAISNIRVLKRLVKDLCVPSAKSLSDKMIDIFYNVEKKFYWLFYLTLIFFFTEQAKRSGHKQATALSSVITKKVRINFVLLSKPVPQGSSPRQTDPMQRIKLISIILRGKKGGKLIEGSKRRRKRLAVSNDKIAPFLTTQYRKLQPKHPKKLI